MLSRSLSLPERILALALATLAVHTLARQVLPARDASPEAALEALEDRLDLARLEAMRNGRETRILISPGRVRILDSQGTADPADDRVLHDLSGPASPPIDGPLPAELRFSPKGVPRRPDGSVPPPGSV